MRPSRDQIADEVRAFLATDVRPMRDPSFYEDDLPLVTTAVVDSIAMARLITFLEKTFAVEFNAWEVSAEYLDTVGLIAATVSEKLEAQ